MMGLIITTCFWFASENKPGGFLFCGRKMMRIAMSHLRLPIFRRLIFINHLMGIFPEDFLF